MYHLCISIALTKGKKNNKWMNEQKDGQSSFNWSITSDNIYKLKIYIYLQTYLSKYLCTFRRQQQRNESI